MNYRITALALIALCLLTAGAAAAAPHAVDDRPSAVDRFFAPLHALWAQLVDAVPRPGALPLDEDGVLIITIGSKAPAPPATPLDEGGVIIITTGSNAPAPSAPPLDEGGVLIITIGSKAPAPPVPQFDESGVLIVVTG
ncbi:MAG: hypothetical protein AAF772_17750 [Acidobacteriota bacterium]